MYRELVEKLLQGRHLRFSESYKALREILDGNITPVQVSALLTALRMNGETPEEIAGFALAMKERAVKLDVEADIDTAGTGGDGMKTFNVSTAAALLLSGRLRVLKHGNRAVSSSSGSADFLEKLGYNIALSPLQVKRALERSGFAFVFAQLYHPSMKAVAPIRKELGFRTIFNVLGPLTNPGKVKSQVIGVYSRDKIEVLGEAAELAGLKRLAIVHGEPSMDEVSPVGYTDVLLIVNGRSERFRISPEDFGARRVNLNELLVSSSEDSVQKFIDALSGRNEAIAEFIAINAAFGLFIAGAAESPKDGYEQARSLIDGFNERLRIIVEASKSEG
ncbi:MAG: anthranilate phosphoribosyltransferase [Nitrososphaeria archaeon]